MSLLDNCNPRIITVDSSCGCTMTRADIRAWTAQDVEDLGFKEVGMDKLIAQTKELRMTGVQQRSLTDLLLSRMKPGKKSIAGAGNGRSVISPFSLVPQRHRINSNYWVIQAGSANANAGVGAIPASAWDFTIINDGGDFGSDLVSLENYFLPGKYLVVMTQDPTTHIGRTLQYKVLSAINADAGGVSKAKVTVEPNFSAAGWAAMSAGDKAVYQATTGVAVNLANSVSDYESWCSQYPAENTLKLRDFWWQTIRKTWCYNEEYVKALQAPLTGTFFRNFRTLPLAEQRKRQGMQEERDFYNTVFYGQRINEFQTQGTYTSLPQVVDPANAECLIEYKANTEGIRTQLANCGKVIDMQNATLDLDTIKSLLYSIKRHREQDSGSVTRIDAFTNRFTYASVINVMINYYKAKYGLDTTRFYKVGEKLSFQDFVMWEYCIFEFPEDGFELALFRDTYFDDMLGAFPTAIAGRGRAIWFIDWSDIDIAVDSIKSVNRQTNVADNLYNCVIQPNVNHYQLQSQTIQVQVGDPNRHLLVENFSSACPRISLAGTCYPYS